jgi:hypothetical protein
MGDILVDVLWDGRMLTGDILVDVQCDERMLMGTTCSSCILKFMIL